jgi:hypothetical protein
MASARRSGRPARTLVDQFVPSPWPTGLIRSRRETRSGGGRAVAQGRLVRRFDPLTPSLSPNMCCGQVGRIGDLRAQHMLGARGQEGRRLFSAHPGISPIACCDQPVTNWMIHPRNT